MGEGEGIVEKALNSLGKGFDLTSDFRLKFCKGEKSLVLLNEFDKREMIVPGFGTIKDVSVDIKCDKGDRTHYQSDILTFTQMSELFNQKSSILGKIPSGYFNAMFGFDEGSWAAEEANTKGLGLDGYLIKLFNLHIHHCPLNLSKQVLQDVPSSWDPPALARFIEKFGTHILVGLSIGGKDLLLVKQDVSSKLGPSELKNHLDELGDQLFSGTCNFLPKNKDHKHKVPSAFNVFGPQIVAFNGSTSVCTKDGITVICAKRGGDTEVSSHSEWLLTVPSKADAVDFSFIPITSLLKALPGRGFLSHAINLYLRYKPPMSDLPYFLDYQSHKLWAPVHNDLPLGPATNITTLSPFLTLNFMGPKLYVNTDKVTVGKRPITGMRLFLEGMKNNRLAIHVQHLLNTPIMLSNKIEDTTIWSEEINDERFFEPINGKKFCHVCTSSVKYNPGWSSNKDVSFIVTGAQLHVKKHDTKSVLHLRLLFSKVSNSFVVKSNWTQGSSRLSQKSSIFSAISTSISSKDKDQQKATIVLDSIGKRPITGMRLFLEGMKNNRLAIHVQHLLNTPIMLSNKIEDTTIWSEEINDERFFEPINGKKFCHVCTSSVKYNPGWSSNKDVSFIVTGAQLHVKKHDTKSVLHLRLLFSKVSNSFVVKSNWTQGSSRLSQKSSIFSAISTSISSKDKDQQKATIVLDSSVFPTGPPVPVQTQKMLKFVDTSQLCKGPQDSPGHWLVTGAKLVMDKGKICLWAKFSLLNIAL